MHYDTELVYDDKDEEDDALLVYNNTDEKYEDGKVTNHRLILIFNPTPQYGNLMIAIPWE